MPFALLISFLLNGVRGAVQGELDAFFALHGAAPGCAGWSRRRPSPRHARICWAPSWLNAELLRLIEAIVGVPRWQGLRVLAGDGSKLQLMLCDRAGRRAVPEVLAFGLFLPGIELFESLVLDPVGNEHQVLFEQLDRLGRRDLLVLDRGFPAAWLVSVLLARGIAFCIRCDSTSGFDAVRRFLRSGKTEAMVTLPAPNRTDAADYECLRTPSTVRLIRDVTPCGRVRVLMTSLTDAGRYPAAAFAQLYHGRWRIEEGFKRLKHRLNMEHTSGMSWLAAQQDVGAKMVCDNLNALAAYLAAQQHLPEDLPWRINRTLAFNSLRRVLPRALGLRILAQRVVAQVLAEIARNLQKFVSHRRRPLPPGPKPHKFPAYKPAV